jgi:preprotein translocase subunit Sss1
MEERVTQMPPARPAPPVVVRPASRVRAYRGAAHDVLFGLLIALGLFGLLRAVSNSPAISVIGGAILLGVVVALVVALVRQQDSDLAPRVRRIVWVAIGYLVVSFSLAYGTMMISLMRNAKGNEPDAVYRFLTGGAPPSAEELIVVMSIVGCGIGVMGAMRMRAFRAARRAGGPAAPPSLHP